MLDKNTTYLVESDLWRDGGSYSATILRGTEKLSFWLQVNQWDNPKEKNYENLYFSEGNDPLRKQTQIAIVSDEEREWLMFFHEVNTQKSAPESIERFGEMISILQKRCESKS